jgi:hypothetical protein
MFEVRIIEIETDEVMDTHIVSAKELQAIRKGYFKDNFYRFEYTAI